MHTFEKSRYRSRADGNVPPNFNVARPQLARHDRYFFARLRVFDEEKLRRQQLAEAAMQLDNGRGRGWLFRHAVLVDPFLDRDMRFGFELKVSPRWVGAVVALHRAFDVDGMGVVPFDEVTVVAVHRPHEICQRLRDGGRQPAPERGRLFCQLEREIV